MHHQRPGQNIVMKNIYVGNLPEDVTKQDICKFFGLKSDSHLPKKYIFIGANESSLK